MITADEEAISSRDKFYRTLNELPGIFLKKKIIAVLTAYILILFGYMNISSILLIILKYLAAKFYYLLCLLPYQVALYFRLAGDFGCTFDKITIENGPYTSETYQSAIVFPFNGILESCYI